MADRARWYAIGRPASSVRRLLSGDRGSGLVELAMVVPFLVLFLLGAVDASRALGAEHRLSVLSREGANIASRGSTLAETLAVVLANGTDLNLGDRGGVVASRIVVQGTTPVVEAQQASAGYEERSLLGLPDSAVTALTGLDFDDGQSLYAVEIFLDYSRVSPLPAFISGFIDTLYERAIF